MTTDCKTATHASNVYLFKNGYGMIVKTFEFPPNEGKTGNPVELIDPPSNPIHGTFWIQAFSKNSMSFFSSYFLTKLFFISSFHNFNSNKKDTNIS